MLSDQLNTFNVILGYWKNQYEKSSEINSQFENLTTDEILEEQAKSTSFPVFKSIKKDKVEECRQDTKKEVRQIIKLLLRT